MNYADLLQEGITIAVSNNDCKEKYKLKNGSLLIKKAFPDVSLVLTNHSITNNLKERKLLAENVVNVAERLKKQKEAV